MFEKIKKFVKEKEGAIGAVVFCVGCALLVGAGVMVGYEMKPDLPKGLHIDMIPSDVEGERPVFLLNGKAYYPIKK